MSRSDSLVQLHRGVGDVFEGVFGVRVFVLLGGRVDQRATAVVAARQRLVVLYPKDALGVVFALGVAQQHQLLLRRHLVHRHGQALDNLLRLGGVAPGQSPAAAAAVLTARHDLALLVVVAVAVKVELLGRAP